MHEPWYVRAFAEEYLQLYSHRTPEQGRLQVAQMLASGLLPRAGAVLDLCCGAGRHLLPMRAAGLDAVGLDLSAALIQAGKLQQVAVRADARAIPFAGGRFDVVTNLFSSFGYFDDEEDHLRVLREVARVLKPRGRLILDHMNPAVTVRDLLPGGVEQRPGFDVHVQRRYDEDSSRVVKDIQFTPHGQPSRRWQESVRLFQPAELDELFAAAGFRTVARYGDLDASPFDEKNSSRQVVVAAVDPTGT